MNMTRTRPRTMPDKMCPIYHELLAPCDIRVAMLQSLLNKLTPENFDRMLGQLCALDLSDEQTLQGIIGMIYEKSITEVHFCEMYARLCRKLHEHLESIEVRDEPSSEKKSFKRILLTRCQAEWEKKKEPPPEGESEEDQEKRIAKEMKRSMGNVKLCGELFKTELVTEKVIHGCIRKLLNDIVNPAHEDIESLCNLMTTIGSKLDQEKAQGYMTQYFERMTAMIQPEVGLPVRLKFMIQDIIDLRGNNWKVRGKARDDAGPRTLTEIHREVAAQAAKDGKGGKGGKGGGGGLGPPSLAHLRAARPAGKGGAPVMAGPGGSGGFGGGPAIGKGGNSGRAGRPGEGGGMYVSSKKGQAQGTILNPVVKKLTAEEREAKTSGMLREYLASGDVEEACESLKSLKSHYEEAMVYVGTEMLEKRDNERASMGALMVAACKAKVVKETDAAKAIVALFGLVEDMEMDIPKAGIYVAECAAGLVGAKCVTLADLKEGLEPLAPTGKAAKLAARMLVVIAEAQEEACARELWVASEIDLTQWLAEGERDEEHTFAFATDNHVEWLYPFMGCKQHMHEAFAAKETP